MKSFKNSILIVLLLLAILLCGLLFPLVTSISHDMARWNPNIAYMRVPLLIMSYFVIATIIAALMSGLLLVIRSTHKNIFEHSTVKALLCMGNLFIFATIISVAMFIYSYSQIQGEVGLVGAYMNIASLILFLGANIMYFIASLFRKAVEYKEEYDLTV